jgi:hypothetical protein
MSTNIKVPEKKTKVLIDDEIEEMSRISQMLEEEEEEAHDRGNVEDFINA